MSQPIPRKSVVLPSIAGQIKQFLDDSKKMIRKGQYRQCLKVMDPQLDRLLGVSCKVILRIKLCRRLIHCILMILTSYIKHEEITIQKRVPALLSRIEHYLLIYTNSINEVISHDNHNGDFEIQISYDKKIKWLSNKKTISPFHLFKVSNRQLINFHLRELVKLIIRTLQIRSIVFKCIQLDVRGIITFLNYQNVIFNKYEKQRHQIIENEAMYHIQLGILLFQLQFFDQAIGQLQNSLKLFQLDLQFLFHHDQDIQKEKSKKEANQKFSRIIFALYILSYACEQQQDINKSLESLRLAEWLSQFFFFNSFGELKHFVKLRFDQMRDLYFEEMQEQIELEKCFRFLCPDLLVNVIYQEVQQQNNDLFEIFTSDFYSKHHHGELNRSQYIIFDENRKIQTEPINQMKQSYHVSSPSKFVKTEDSVSPKNWVKSFEFDATNSKSMNEKQTTQLSKFNSNSKELSTKNLSARSAIQNQNIKQRKLMKEQRFYTLQCEEILQNGQNQKSQHNLNSYFENIIYDQCNFKQLENQSKVYEQKNLQHYKLKKLFDEDCSHSLAHLKFKRQFSGLNLKNRSKFDIKSLHNINSQFSRANQIHEGLIQSQLYVKEENKRRDAKPSKNISLPSGGRATQLKNIILNKSSALGLRNIKKEVRNQQSVKNSLIDQTENDQDKIQGQVNQLNKHVIQLLMDQYEDDDKKMKNLIHSPRNQKKSLLSNQQVMDVIVQKNQELSHSTKFLTVRSQKQQKINTLSDLILLTTKIKQSEQHNKQRRAQDKFISMIKRKTTII